MSLFLKDPAVLGRWLSKAFLDCIRQASSGLGVEWSGVEWSGVEWSGVEWSGVVWTNNMHVIGHDQYQRLH
jgi:hypothetical protein